MKRFLRILCFFVLELAVAVGGFSSYGFAQPAWSVCIYLCGSDLETTYGSASANLDALKSVQLPDNVEFVIQTGGAMEWHTKGIPNDALARYVYDHTGFHEVERLADASMGDKETLRNFLQYAKDNHPADHRMLVLWDHGGGSLGGFCWDEGYNNEISLKSFRQVLEEVEKSNPDNPAFDLVAFDTCLMASLETANTLYGFTRYMAASQELMPSTGTDYAGWAGALAKNPAIDGRELGTVMCQTYLPYCRVHEVDDMATYSLIDLSKLPALNAAYENMGIEALQAVRRDPRFFFTALERVADGVEKYGTNSEDDWTNMIDLGSLSEKVEGLDTAPAFTKALQDAVVYRVAGPYRQHGMGLSGYYGMDGRLSSWQTYDSLPMVSPSFSKLYMMLLSGSDDGKQWFQFNKSAIENTPLELDADNQFTISISPEDANSICNASLLLGFYDENNEMILLGSDSKIEADWENGKFRENFDGMWPALNGHFLPINLDEENADYNIYYSYILLNGDRCYLSAAYNYEKQAFELLGAQRILKEGWLDREIKQLKKGDKIVPLFTDMDGNEVKGEKFILESEPVLQDEQLPDDTYVFAFNFTAPRNEYAISQPMHLVVQNGEITAMKS